MSRAPLPNADASVHESDEDLSGSSEGSRHRDGASAEDEEFDMAQYRKPAVEAKKVADKHYDEAVELSDEQDESVASPRESPRQRVGNNQGVKNALAANRPTPSHALSKNGDSDSEEDEGAGASSEGRGGVNQTKLYNPNDFAHLQVSSEVQDLFDYIGRYKVQEIDLETRLKPFIPDYIPAIGEIDAFIKVPHPEDKDELGLSVLDEPAAHQSDPTVLDLQLRVVSKQANMKPVAVRAIEAADKNPKKITKWIQSIEEVHRQKPPPTVNYSREMPDIESLMQAWPTEFEQLLKSVDLPSPHLELDTAEFARVVCALLDIPVYEKTTESLHVLFTLFAEFKSNAHFQQM